MPAALDDVVAAYGALRRRYERVALFGDSAGGGLVIETACALRDAGASPPVATAVVSPWADLTLSGAHMADKAPLEVILTIDGFRRDALRYAGASSVAAVSPLRLSLEGLPPTLIQVGEAELLYDDSVRLAERMSGAGTAVRLEIWESMVHSWHAFGDLLPEASLALGRVAEFLEEHLSASEPAGAKSAARPLE